LKPEQGKSVEIGAKYENADFNAMVSLFNINIISIDTQCALSL